MLPEVAAAAVLAVLGCSAGDPGLRRDLELMRAEMRTVQHENAEMAKRIEALSAKVDLVAARAQRAPPAADKARAAAPAEPIVPPDLAVVRMEPQAARSAPRTEAPRRPRRAPPVPVAVPFVDPDPATLGAMGARKVDLAAEAQTALDAAHRLSGLATARALEEFSTSYPSHPSADNALVEAGRARASAGDDESACALFARSAKEYPAGDALPDALEQLGSCEYRKGHAEKARALFERVAQDFPSTSAAKRALERIAAMPGTGASGAPSPRQGAVP
jgi:TolA-binding protein